MSSPVKVGDILAGKYQVERVLGVGGMGVVVAAKHLTLGERVAIKFLLPQALARNDVVARFIKEGQAANRLKGEHVTRVHDVGKLVDGAPFLVMEYLDGSDLGAIIREKGRMPVEDVVEYVMQACEALAEAHSIGIVHRDLKPSNLFLIKRLDGSPSIKLIDFGISKVTSPGAEGAEGEMTQTAVMMGSPLYMAPEQMASARDVDGRADIWSLGIILHTALTGSPPFKAPSVMQIYELIVQGATPIRKLRADVPEGVEAIILKCLQKDRKQRYPDVGVLAESLAEFGPPQSRFHAERIKRIVASRASTNSIPPPASTDVPVAAITPAPSGGPISDTKPASAPDSKGSDATPPPSNMSVSNSGLSQPSGSSVGADPQNTGGPWDQKTHPPSKRPRPAALIAASVAAVLIGGPLAFYLLRGHDGAGTAPGADPTAARASLAVGNPSSSGAVSAEPSQPAVLPGSPVGTSSSDKPGPDASAAPRATATASAEPSSTGRVRRTPPPLPPPGGARSAPPRAPRDPFDTQK